MNLGENGESGEVWNPELQVEMDAIVDRLPKNPQTGLPIHRPGENDEDVKRYNELLRLKRSSELSQSNK